MSLIGVISIVMKLDPCNFALKMSRNGWKTPFFWLRKDWGLLLILMSFIFVHFFPHLSSWSLLKLIIALNLFVQLPQVLPSSGLVPPFFREVSKLRLSESLNVWVGKIPSSCFQALRMWKYNWERHMPCGQLLRQQLFWGDYH